MGRSGFALPAGNKGGAEISVSPICRPPAGERAKKPPLPAAGNWAPQGCNGVLGAVFFGEHDVAGEFELAIVGDGIKYGNDVILINILKSRFEKFAPDYQVRAYRFARLSYRFIVEGTPERLDYLDNMIKSVKTYTPKYFRNWGYSIRVKFEESGQ